MILPKYWICDDCAKKENLVCKKIGNTRVYGFCAHCESVDEKLLTPVVDFVKVRNEVLK